METQDYTLQIVKNKYQLLLAINSIDAAHAQAQACDIARALKADKFHLTYEKTEDTGISNMFKRLAFSEFSYKECALWEGKLTAKAPVFYTLGERYYVRTVILDYLDVHRDNYVRPSCGCHLCINPLHNSFKSTKASKITGAETKLALAFASQGTSVTEIAKALKVHRSTIYRILKHERFYPRSESDKRGTRGR